MLAAGTEARASGLPLIMHATELRTAKVALRAGAHLLVHSVRDTVLDDEFIELARRSGTIYCPTLTVADGYERLMSATLNGRAPDLDDPNSCVDAHVIARLAETATLGAERVDTARFERMRDRRSAQVAIMAANLRRALESGIPVAMGTDAGNPLTLHGPSVYTEMEAMQTAGLTPIQVLTTATRNGARAMGREADFGTIQAGKIADLLVLDADPTQDIRNMRALRHVMRAGELRDAHEYRRHE